MKTQLYPKYTYCLLFCLQAVSQAADVTKAYNSTALNLTGSWSGGVLPTASDTILWNNLYTIPAVDNALGPGILSQLGANLSVAGLRVTDVGGTRNLGNPSNLVGFRDTVPAASSFTLTIGAGGIDMATANQSMMIQSRIALSADQTWNISNANTNGNPMTFNNGEDLGIASQAAAVPFDLGGRTLTTTGNGQITITGGYTLSNGTIQAGNDFMTIQGGTSRTTTIANTVNLVANAGTLRIQANSGSGGISLASAAPVTVNGGIFSMRCNTGGQSVTQSGNVTLNSGSGLSFQLDQNGPVTLSGAISVAGPTTWRVAGGGSITNAASLTGNITGSGNITYLNAGTGATGGFVRLAGDNSGYSGTITLSGTTGNRSLTIGSANSGSAAATWNVGANNILQVNGVTAQLGNLQGSGTVTNSSTTTLATIVVGAGEFSGPVANGGSQPVAVTKTGSGLLRLTGPNTYTGATTVNGGTLLASPDQTGITAVTVADGAGYGVVWKNTGPTLSAGNITVGTATGGTLQFDFGTSTNPFSPLLSADALTFNGPSTIKIVGSNLTPGTFPLAQYTSYAGTAVGGLNLVLPTRTTGSLADSGSEISLTIDSTEEVKWNGDLTDDWDIDPTGSGGSGTANWKTTDTNASTRYIQGPAGSDSVNFDDSASGTGTVNLTTTLSPVEIVVNNTAKNYTFAGGGKLTGFARLTKSGTGSLTIANTTPNDYVGGTIIEAGTLRLGDGVTAGAGQLVGSIENSGTLVLNRPDNHDFTNTLTGLGSLEKAQASTVTFTAATTLNSPLVISGGKIRFGAGGAINDVVSGSGELEASGGTLTITGADPNTHTGMTTVSAGALQLSKSAGVNAVAGDVTITGTGALNILADEQIPDTATLHVLGSNADSISGTPGKETFANAIVTGSVPTTQLILRTNATITNTATVNQGILGVASNNTANINAVVLTSPTSILRVAGGSNPSFMNIGAGGITASAGEVQVKFNTAEFDATLNLSGNVTTTGNMAFTNGGYTGAMINAIRLDGSRTFDIGAGTLTTVAPDIANFINSEAVEVPGTLIKAGDGALVLDASSTATHTGGTVVNAGAMRVHGNLGGTLLVNANGSIGGNGTLSGAATIHGRVTPGGAGVAMGHLHASSSLNFMPDSDYLVEVGNWAGTTPGTDWDTVTVDTLAFSATPSNKLVIHVTGAPTGFTETNKTIVVATSTQPVLGFDASAIQIDSSGFSGTGTWAVQLTGNTIELVYTAGSVSAYSAWASAEGLTPSNNDPADDPDQDGQDNLMEFALNGVALSGKSSGKVVGKVGTVAGQQALTITLPVRNGVDFTGDTELTGAADGILYRIQATDALSDWDLEVSEVTGADATAIQADLPGPLPSGWTYRTFRSPGAITGDPREYIRVVTNPAG